jgi:hypothetical protein
MYRLGSVLGLVPRAVRRSRSFDVLVSAFDWHDAPSARPPVADLEAWSYTKIRLEVIDLAARVPALAVVLMPCKKALADGRDPYGPLAHDLAAAGVPVLASTAGIRRVAAALPPLFFRDDPHLNTAGNRALAAVVAAWLVAERLLPPPPAVMAVRAPNG